MASVLSSTSTYQARRILRVIQGYSHHCRTMSSASRLRCALGECNNLQSLLVLTHIFTVCKLELYGSFWVFERHNVHFERSIHFGEILPYGFTRSHVLLDEPQNRNQFLWDVSQSTAPRTEMVHKYKASATSNVIPPCFDGYPHVVWVLVVVFHLIAFFSSSSSP